jgi:hypothetical protein
MRQSYEQRLAADTSPPASAVMIAFPRNITGFFTTLAEWSRAEIPSPPNDTGKPVIATLRSLGLWPERLPPDHAPRARQRDQKDRAGSRRRQAYRGRTCDLAGCNAGRRIAGRDVSSLVRLRGWISMACCATGRGLIAAHGSARPSMDTMNNVFLFREQSHPRTGSLMLIRCSTRAGHRFSGRFSRELRALSARSAYARQQPAFGTR